MPLLMVLPVRSLLTTALVERFAFNTALACNAVSSVLATANPAEIAVKYDTKRVGGFTKTITVTTNVGEPIVLTIKGTVLPENKTAEPAKQAPSTKSAE